MILPQLGKLNFVDPPKEALPFLESRLGRGEVEKVEEMEGGGTVVDM